MSTEEANNLIVVTSSEHFKSLLSKDLERVSLINFWTPWAEPCKQMNEVVFELARKHPEALVLQVSVIPFSVTHTLMTPISGGSRRTT